MKNNEAIIKFNNAMKELCDYCEKPIEYRCPDCFTGYCNECVDEAGKCQSYCYDDVPDVVLEEIFQEASSNLPND